MNAEYPRRILVAASTFPRRVGDGVPDFVWKQVRELKRSNPEIQIHVLAPHDRGALQSEEWEGILIHRYKYLPERFETLAYPAIWPNLVNSPLKFLQVPFLMLSLLWHAFMICVRYRVDAIYSHWFMPQGVACSIPAMLFRIRHVLTAHASDVSVLWKVPFVGPTIVRLLIPKFHAITVDGHSGMQKLSAFFSAERWDELSARVRVMPMGIDPECLPSPADALGREPRTLLFLGRLSEKKGVSDLLDAAATLSREYPGFRLLIAGAGPLESGLREHVRILEMEEVVEFLGFVDESGKKECFARASIQVAPSIKTSDGDEEGLPVAILEGLAAGLIVVATDESGACDVIEQGKSGFIVPARSPESISETVRRIFHLTELERNQVSENARRAGLEFVWEKQAKRLFGFLFSRRSQ